VSERVASEGSRVALPFRDVQPTGSLTTESGSNRYSRMGTDLGVAQRRDGRWRLPSVACTLHRRVAACPWHGLFGVIHRRLAIAVAHLLLVPPLPLRACACRVPLFMLVRLQAPSLPLLATSPSSTHMDATGAQTVSPSTGTSSPGDAPVVADVERPAPVTTRAPPTSLAFSSAAAAAISIAPSPVFGAAATHSGGDAPSDSSRPAPVAAAALSAADVDDSEIEVVTRPAAAVAQHASQQDDDFEIEVHTRADKETYVSSEEQTCSVPTSSGEDVPPCALCPARKHGSGRFLPSEILGPFRSATGRSDVYVHHACAMWAPEVFWDGKARSLRNVYKAFIRGRRLTCSGCSARGATIGCCIESCTEVYHYLCLASAGCVVRMSKYMAFCKSHQRLASEMPGEPLVAAGLMGVFMARNAVRYPPSSDDDTSINDSVDSWDTPHSRYTRLRRHDTEMIFSRAWQVGTIVPEQAKTLVSLKEGRVVRSGEALSTRIGLRVVTRSVANFVISRHKAAGQAAAAVPHLATTRRSARLFLLRNFRHAPKIPPGNIRMVVPMVSSRVRRHRAPESSRQPYKDTTSGVAAAGVRQRVAPPCFWDKLRQRADKRRKVVRFAPEAAGDSAVTPVTRQPPVDAKSIPAEIGEMSPGEAAPAALTTANPPASSRVHAMGEVTVSPRGRAATDGTVTATGSAPHNKTAPATAAAAAAKLRLAVAQSASIIAQTLPVTAAAISSCASKRKGQAPATRPSRSPAAEAAAAAAAARMEARMSDAAAPSNSASTPAPASGTSAVSVLWSASAAAGSRPQSASLGNNGKPPGARMKRASYNVTQPKIEPVDEVEGAAAGPGAGVVIVISSDSD